MSVIINNNDKYYLYIIRYCINAHFRNLEKRITNDDHDYKTTNDIITRNTFCFKF